MIEVRINIEFEEMGRMIWRSRCVWRSSGEEWELMDFEIMEKRMKEGKRGVRV